MKQNQIILWCCIIMLMFTACNKGEKANEKTQTIKDITGTKEDTETKDTRLELKWDEESSLWKEPFLTGDDLIENYIPDKEVVGTDKRIGILEIEMPNTLNNEPVNQIMAFFSYGKKALIELQNEKKEQSCICVYDFDSRECKELFRTKDYLDAGTFTFRTFVEDGIIFASSIPEMGGVRDAHLWIYDMKDKTLKKIYDYNTQFDGCQNMNIFMNVEVIGERILFDDFEYDVESKEYISNLYFYDFVKDEVVLEKEKAIKPIKYKDSYACFVEDGHGTNYCTLVDCDGNILWNVDEYGSMIVSNGTDIFIIAKATSDETQTTKNGLMGIDKKQILVTYGLMEVSLNEKWMMIDMACYQCEGYPILYNLQEEKIYELENLPKTLSYYYMPVYGSNDCVININSKFYLLSEQEESWKDKEIPVYENALEYDNELLAKALENSNIDETLINEMGINENNVELIRKWANQQKERYENILNCGEKKEIVDSKAKKLAEAANGRVKMILGGNYDAFCELIGANLQ